MIKSAAAYLRAFLGAEQPAAAEEGAVPTKDDMRHTMGNVGEQMEEAELDELYALTYGVGLAELIAAGSGAAAAALGVANAAAESKEEEEEDKDEEDFSLFILF